MHARMAELVDALDLSRVPQGVRFESSPGTISHVGIAGVNPMWFRHSGQVVNFASISLQFLFTFGRPDLIKLRKDIGTTELKDMRS